jgi:hypothetical protein
MITVGIALRGCNVAVWAAAVGQYLPSTPPSRCDQGRRHQQQENRARHFKSHMSLACPPHFSMQLVLSRRFNTADRHCRYCAQRRKTSSSAGSGKGIDDEFVRSFDQRGRLIVFAKQAKSGSSAITHGGRVGP